MLSIFSLAARRQDADTRMPRPSPRRWASTASSVGDAEGDAAFAGVCARTEAYGGSAIRAETGRCALRSEGHTTDYREAV